MNAFVTKLGHGASLSELDKSALSALTNSLARATKNRDILAARGADGSLPVVLKGWACRYQLLASGKRQIIALYLPGDLCEPFGLLPGFKDHPIEALTPLTYALVNQEQLRRVAHDSAACEKALWWDLLVGTNIERERIVSLGRRSASERMGHLFCELEVRLRIAGLPTEGGYDMPLTQSDVADLLGLTAVHVNRSLQDLRKSGLISLQNRRLVIRQARELQELSSFDPFYLHTDQARLASQ